MTSLEDIFVWADDSWMYREDYYDTIWKSDDYHVLEFGTEEYDRFIQTELDADYEKIGV